ncbi:MAG: hypothetical protein V3T24_05315 [Longimicrobiales bacterium]
MHLLLTDRLTCPRCGPDFGLVLLADELEDRRLLKGSLGCSNCRERYPVVGGFGDLRPPPREAIPASATDAPSQDEAVRLGALLGVTKGPGEVALLGPLALNGRALAALIPGVEVVCVGSSVRGWPEEAGVSRLTSGPRLPFFSGVMRGVALSGAGDEGLLDEAVRILARGGRLVVVEASERSEPELVAHGLELVLHEGSVLVARRP